MTYKQKLIEFAKLRQTDIHEGMEIILLVDRYEMKAGKYLIVDARFPLMILRRLNKNGNIRKNGPLRYLFKTFAQQDFKNRMMVLGKTGQSGIYLKRLHNEIL